MSSSTTQVKEVEKPRNPLTARAFAIGLIWAIIVAFMSVVNAGLSGQSNPGIDRVPWMMLIMLILSIIVTPMLRSMKFSTGELVVVYVMTMVNAFGGGKAFGSLMYPLSALSSDTLGSLAQDWMPDIWFPKDRAIWEPMLAGGAPVPWSAWVVPMLYWIIIQLFWVGIGLSFGLILRRSILEVERLPFPYTQVLEPIVVKPERPLKERLHPKLFIIGLVIGFFIQGTYFLFPKVIPGFPQIYPVGFWGIKGYDFGEILGADIYRNQLLVFFFENAPSAFSLFFLLPTKVLGSALLVHFIWANIVPYTEVTLGMVTNLGNWGLYSLIGWAITMIGTSFEPTGIQWYTFFTIGFPVGYVLTYLFFVRKSIATSLKEAISGERTESLAWIFFIISIIGYLALSFVGGVSLLTALVFLVFSFVYLVQTIRMRGEVIVDSPPIFANMLGLAFETAGGEAARNTPQMFIDLYHAGCIQNQAWMLQGRGAHWAPLEGMRLLEMSGEKWDWKPLVFATVVALVISVVVSWIVNLWGTYTYGQITQWSVATYSDHILSDLNDLYNTLTTPGAYPTGTAPLRWPEAVAGFVVAVVVTVCNALFAWWPLHPLGFLVGITLGWGFWNWALLAFIARVIILRVGGSRLYNKAVKMVLGSLMGVGLISILEFIVRIAGY